MARYQLFVDDSGTREYDANRNYNTSGKSLYFVYGAILIEQDYAASSLIPSLRELKRLTFGTAHVEIKSNWLRMPGERQKHYLVPFDITEEALAQFTDDYYRLLIQAQLVLLGSVVNKLHMQEDYPTPWYPHTAAYELLLQRAVQATTPGSTLAVTVDAIGGKTPKQNEYQDLLKSHHSSLMRYGSSLQKKISFACLQSPVRFVSSEHSDLIQAADLVSYNVNRQFMDHGEVWETLPTAADGRLPMYPYFERIAEKFRRHTTGRVQGFGIVKFPLRNRISWRAEADKEKGE